MNINIKYFKSLLNILIIVVLLIILVILGFRFIYKKYLYPTKYNKYVQKAAVDNNIDPYLIFAIIKQESKFNKNALSNKDAKGLMQILDTTAKEVATDIKHLDENNLDLFDASTNICIGVKYFKTLLDRYDGNIHLAICAYNAGLGNVDKWKESKHIYSNGHVNISNIPFEETKNYLINILNYYDKYVKLYKN